MASMTGILLMLRAVQGRRYPVFALSARRSRRQEQGDQLPVQLTDAKSQAVFSRQLQGMTIWRLMAENRLRLGVCQLH
jgi:hypothetical protein